jgi:hypothetical protein
MALTKEYPVTRYTSIEGRGNQWQVWNNVTGLLLDRVYGSYAEAKQAAREIGDAYYHTERRAGWR